MVRRPLFVSGTIDTMQRTYALTAPEDATIPRSTKELLLQMVRPYRTKTVLFFSLTFLGIIAWTASPFVISKIVTALSKTHTVDHYIWTLVVVYGCLRVLDEGLWRLGELVMRSYKPQMIERMRLTLFTAVLKKPYAFFVNSSSGRIGHWINQTTVTTGELVDVTIWNVWGRTTSLLVAAFFLFTVHWALALLFIAWLILLFAYNVYRGKRFGKLVARQSDETSKAAGLVVDAISNHVSVRVFGAQASESNLLAKQQDHIIHSWRDSWAQNLFTNMIKGQSAAVVSAGALCLVVVLFMHGMVQLGGIVLFISYFGDASSSLWELAWALDSYYRNFGTVQNALDGLQSADERPTRIPSTIKKQKKGVELQLEAVQFAYPERPDTPVLDAFDLHIRPGEKVGIVGHSGAGKSTLVGLLLGFYEPTGGTIRLNGRSANTLGPAFIRQFCSYVPQDTNLFNRSIRENVIYARTGASDDEIRSALQQAQAYSFVQKLPNTLDTIIGERGVKLSGGQRQRIAIARALLQNAPLLILDEATSALDSVSEQAIQKALHELMQHRTAIVIAHRLSTLKNLDRIIVLDEGRIAEQGTHTELLA